MIPLLRFQSSSPSDQVADRLIQVLDLLVDEAQEFFTLPAGELGQLLAQAVLLGHAHPHQGPAPGDQVVRVALFFRQFLQGAVSDAAAELGQAPGVDAVGLLQATRRAGELAGPLRVDQRDRDAGREQLAGQAAVQPAGRLDDDQLDRRERAQLRDEPDDPVGVVGYVDPLANGVEVAVEHRLGDVDADDDGNGRRIVFMHGGFPALRMRTAARGGVQPAVRVKYTRPPTISLCDGVLNTGTRSICRRPPRRGLLATLRSPRRGMLD